jgi:hypothetical protein
VKTDKVDAGTLNLFAAGCLPEIWMPDAETLAMIESR